MADYPTAIAILKIGLPASHEPIFDNFAYRKTGKYFVCNDGY